MVVGLYKIEIIVVIVIGFFVFGVVVIGNWDRIFGLRMIVFVFYGCFFFGWVFDKDSK